MGNGMFWYLEPYLKTHTFDRLDKNLDYSARMGFFFTQLGLQ